MNVQDYASRDALGIAELIARGEASKAEIVDVAKRAISSVNGDLNALAQPLFDEPLEHSDGGVFHGVPFLLKDSGPTAQSVSFTAGCRLFEGAVSPFDTTLMKRFRAAGLATIGVTAVPEMVISFATESALNGITRNPWDLSRGTGGSSGGAAALVAAGAIPIAHANDGAGSIRLPAACCGVVGLKPTRGRVPTGPGDWEALFGIGCQFAMAKSVRDVAAMLDAVHGYSPGEKYDAPTPGGLWSLEVGRPVSSLRIGFVTSAWSDAPVDSEIILAVEAAVRILEVAGHKVEAVGPQIDASAVLDSYVPMTTAAIANVVLKSEMTPSNGSLAAVSAQLLREAETLTIFDLADSFAIASNVSATIGSFFERYDILVTPTLAQLPSPHGSLDYDNEAHTVKSWLASIFDYGPFTAAFNISGHPAISLPLGQSKAGLPIGVQIVAGFGREDHLIQLASFFEEASPWAHRRPPINAASS